SQAKPAAYNPRTRPRGINQRRRMINPLSDEPTAIVAVSDARIAQCDRPALIAHHSPGDADAIAEPTALDLFPRRHLGRDDDLAPAHGTQDDWSPRRAADERAFISLLRDTCGLPVQVAHHQGIRRCLAQAQPEGRLTLLPSSAAAQRSRPSR